MNGHRTFEHEIRAALDESAPMLPPSHLLQSFEFNARRTRRYPRWLALIKEPTMRTNSRIAVGSPIARVAAIMVATLMATLLVVSAGIAGAQLLAANGPIVVDASGRGTYETITEAVAAATDGDEIVVRPGTYPEAVVIEADIKLHGDGAAEDVVIELADAVLITLNDTNAEIADLTLRGGELTQGIEVVGGAPTIRGLVFDGTGRPYRGGACFAGREACGGGSLTIEGGEAQILGNRFLGGGEVWVHADGNALFEDNELLDGPHVYLADPGDGMVVRDNSISGTFNRAVGQFAPGATTIEGNVIANAGGDGITVESGPDPATNPSIRNNEISGSKLGISVRGEAAAVLTGNRIHDNETGIQDASMLSVLRENELEGNEVGISLSGSPVLEGNAIRNGRIGLMLLSERSTPSLSNNTICDNERNVVLGRGAEMGDDGSNTICEDAPAE